MFQTSSGNQITFYNAILQLQNSNCKNESLGPNESTHPFWLTLISIWYFLSIAPDYIYIYIYIVHGCLDCLIVVLQGTTTFLSPRYGSVVKNIAAMTTTASCFTNHRSRITHISCIYLTINAILLWWFLFYVPDVNTIGTASDFLHRNKAGTPQKEISFRHWKIFFNSTKVHTRYVSILLRKNKTRVDLI